MDAPPFAILRTHPHSYPFCQGFRTSHAPFDQMVRSRYHIVWEIIFCLRIRWQPIFNGGAADRCVRSIHFSGARDGVTPLVGEVILVAICVVLSGAILFTAAAMFPDSSPAPQMAFNKAEKDGSDVKLVLTGAIPETRFIQFKLVVIPPESTSSLEATFTEATTYQLNGTMTMNLVDLGGDGYVSNGDYLTIESSVTMESGHWGFYMIYLADSSATASASVVM